MKTDVVFLSSNHPESLEKDVNILTKRGWKLVSVYCRPVPSELEIPIKHFAWLSKEIKSDQPEKEMD